MEVIPVAHREPPLRNSWGAHSELAARTIVRLVTEDGTVGVGETYGDDQVIDGLERAKEMVVGMNPYERRPLAFRLQDNMVYGAIETALLDIVGKATGQPVHSLLGGKVRDEVEFSAYLFYKYADSDPETAAIAPQEVLSPEALVEEAREFVDRHGFEVLKLKGGVLEPDRELRTLKLLSDEFGRETPLRIDPNGAWSVETSIEIARRLREMEATVQFLEDPVPSMNAHARLKRQVDYPVATNMFVTEFDEIAPAVDTDAVDVILSDHHYWGGLTGNLRLDHVARTFDLGVGMHSNSHLGVSMAAMAQSAAAMPTVRYACDTHYPWMADDVIQDAPIEFEDGAIEVSDEPGLGVDLDMDSVDRLHERYSESETLGYSTVDSMAAEYADGMADVGRSDWLPNKPRW
ncbi:glucarate dehydratase [Halosimplex pelagicum]|uniref:glucarate dehydratase n=2 Tax=Halosimplex pelagicum TaxID=869886 RepID=A0A7D5T9L0_9EURY|nr:enolase C-terminal domain-like protein [Halosimplex pelagicum]QLH82010.1 glucarate dehydratase [Halosimplex pelagicum]